MASWASEGWGIWEFSSRTSLVTRSWPLGVAQSAALAKKNSGASVYIDNKETNPAEACKNWAEQK